MATQLKDGQVCGERDDKEWETSHHLEQGGCEDARSKKGTDEKVKKAEKEGRKTIEKKGKGGTAQGVVGIPFPGLQR